jgi:multisubunit Na+/H+ antiporter MnhB subunit
MGRMMIGKKILLMLLLSLSVTMSFAQDNKTEMADLMRSNGRIYVVVAVVVTILTGLILYLFRLDKKISKLEKEN